MLKRFRQRSVNRPNASPASFAVLTAMACLMGTAAASHGQAWDLARDFSADENPHGPWNFGWQDSAVGPFTPYDIIWGTQEDSAIKGFFSPGWFGTVRAWCKTRSDATQMAALLPPPGELYYPDHWVEANFTGDEVVRQAAGLPSYPDPNGYVSKNMAATPFGSWGYFWEPGMVMLMPPGQRGKEAATVVRWTSPITGRVAVSARFSGQRIQCDAGMRADVRVRQNSTRLLQDRVNGFVGRQTLDFDDRIGPAAAHEWSEVLPVVAGDTIDFVVGAGAKFNYGVFGVQNKQLLPGVGLAVSISPLPDERRTAELWAAAKFAATSQSELASPETTNYGSTSDDPPFSFTYGGKASSELLKSWLQEHTTRRLDMNRIEHTRRFTDPTTGLVVRCVGVAYRDFPTVEWTVYLKNAGADDTPIIENIQALDLSLQRGNGGEYCLHRVLEHRLLETSLAPGTMRRTVDPFPYFNIELPGEGLIVAISWSGRAAIEFVRDAATGLCVRAGQELTHFKLHAGEEVRTPMVVLQFWSGDRAQAQNVWRRWMIAHNMPKPGGMPLKPQRAASSAYQFGNMCNATEENQKHFINCYINAGLKPDYWWMDAGWYPPNISKNGTQLWALTGTWAADKSRFPGGLRAITDHAHAAGIKNIVWFQPERVSPGTWLDDHHPEWLLGAEGADRLYDFGNPDALHWAVDHFSKLVREEGVDVYRQDMNIDPVGFWRANDAEDRQGLSEIRHVTGYLAYLDELLRRNPGLRLDHFRIDLETLRRSAPLILGIDFDPVGDQCHNYRLSSWLPWHGLCSRVIEPYAFRSLMCPAIVTGWDVRRKDLNYDLARRLIGQWETIAPHYFADFYPLTPYSLANDVWMAWQFNSSETGGGIVQAFRRGDAPRQRSIVKLRGLESAATYTITDVDSETSRQFSGQQLMKEGLAFDVPHAPRAALICYRKH